MTKQMLRMKPPPHKQIRTATEEPPWNGHWKYYWGVCVCVGVGGGGRGYGEWLREKF